MTTTTIVEVPSAPDRRWRTRAVLLAKLAVAGGLLTWLFASGRLEFSILRTARHPRLLVPAGLVLLAGLAAVVWRWKWLIEIQQLSISTWTALRLTWLGLFANLFLPGAAGGDLAKAYAACRRAPSAKTRAISTVLLDRVLGLHSMLFIGSAAGLFVLLGGTTARQAAVVWFSVLCLAAASAGLFLLFWQPSSGLAVRLLPRRFRRALGDSLDLYRHGWAKLLGVWAYSAFCNLLAILTYVLVAAALGVKATLAQVLAVPLVIVAMSLPISPGGLGVGEAAASQLFAEFGLANGGLVVLVVRVGIMLLSIPAVLAIPMRASENGAPSAMEHGCRQSR